ncbi:MAG: radical SAM protein [Methanobacteriota archaeon]|nr:MAG: radical SAM protein [Euryarchaeota archaeon]
MEAKVSSETARTKAELLAGGAVRIPRELRLPFSPSRSTAGPGAGSPEMVFSFGGARAKKAISRTSGEFDLVVEGETARILRRGDVMIREVELLPTLFHAPYQAFINVDGSCRLACAFCNAHRLGRDATKNLTDDKIVDMAVQAASEDGFAGVALTSGAAGPQDDSIGRMAELVGRIRTALPESPIGVEPYVTHPRQVDDLRSAGATEIKLNIESSDPDIFDRVCPNRDYGAILHSINHAGSAFGRNSVCSNIIFGLGETDESVLHATKMLANMGAVATLRALRVNEGNAPHLKAAVGDVPPVSADRMLSLARGQKAILAEYGLTPLAFKTMCHACMSCDIVPFWDV